MAEDRNEDSAIRLALACKVSPAYPLCLKLHRMEEDRKNTDQEFLHYIDLIESKHLPDLI